jgi:PAS domain S-box-containing protein
MSTRLRVLIIDDSEDDVTSVVQAIQRGGYDVFFELVSTPEEMHSALVRQTWDIVISDYALDGFSGLEALSQLQESGLDLPFVLVAGNIGEDLAVAAIKAGAHDFVTKHNMARLVPAIQHELQEAQARQARAQAEDALRERQAWYQRLVDTSPDAIIITDLTGKLLMANQRAAELRGCERVEDLLGTNVFRFLTTPDRRRALGDARKAVETGAVRGLEYTMLRDDGTPVSVELSASVIENVQGEPTVFIGVLRDITERVNAQDELRQRNRELGLLNRVSRALSVILDQDQLLLTILSEVRRVFDVAATSLWLIDPTTGETVCQDATGAHRETVRGWRLAPGEGIAGWVAKYGESLIVPDTQIDPRHFTGVDDQIRLGVRSLLTVPLRARQDVIGVIQVVDTVVDRFSSTDLTLMEPLASTAAIAIENARLFAKEEQRAAELAYALEQQRELDRFKDQLIQNVSHELRTPLGLIQAYAQLLANGELGELQPRQYEPVAVIARRTMMLSKIVEDLTAILETETHKSHYEMVDLAGLANRLLVDFGVAVEKARLVLEVDVQPDLPPVYGDPTHLNQVLDNLLGNALKFTPAGGSIRVSLTQDRQDLVLRVSDTGVGIPEDQAERVFERFYQVDGSMSRRFGGAGLGLALVKEVVEIHGGSVTLESVVGQGSTFTVTLPVAAMQRARTF